MKARLLVVIFLIVSFDAIFALNVSRRFSLEFNGGASYSTRPMGGANLNSGAGIEFLCHYQILNNFSGYAGWGTTHFTSDNFNLIKIDVYENGYSIGLQLTKPIYNSTTDYFLRAGGIFNQLELESKSGKMLKNTRTGLGFQLAGGILIPFWESWSFCPSIKFNAIDRRVQLAGNDLKLKLHYLSFRLGITKRF